MTIARGSRDLEQLRRGLEAWLSERRGRELAVAELERPSAGLSSETLLADVSSGRTDVSSGSRDEGVEQLVLRLPPKGGGLFPEYRFDEQARMQQVLSGTAVPVADPVEYEPDPTWLGSEFIVMPRVAGRVLTASPSFLATGWLRDAGAPQQARLFTEFIRVVAELHSLDPARFDFLSDRSSLRQRLDRARVYLTWANDDGDVPAFLVAAAGWCEEHLPSDEPEPAVLWGDVQLVNAVFADDLRPAALLDWEMAGVGPPELDLGWFYALHDMMATGNDGDLPGFPERTGALAQYERFSGRTVGDLRWYETFALLRSGSIMVRIARLLARRGVDEQWLTSNNPVEVALRELVR